MAEVHVRGLTKKFGGTVAADNVSLEFPDGQLSVLVGPSGCGKTTLLRILAGLEEPTQGDVFIGDSAVTYKPAWDRNVAMVFQSYALYPHMNVFKNMAFPLEARRMPKAEIKQRVEQTAGTLGLDKLLGRFPRELSGGQMQRVAIGRAIVRKPEVFLMDEPLSNLDAKLRVNMRSQLKRLQKDLGVTTIYVTHDQAEAMTMADQIVVMNNGRVQQVSDPIALYNCPQNTFVAGFIGSPPMNLVEGRLEQNGAHFKCASFDYEFPDSITAGLVHVGAGREVILGIRPDDILVDHAPARFAIAGEIYIFEVLGKETLLTVQCRDIQLKVYVATSRHLAVGEKVWLRPAPEGIRIFDRQTTSLLVNGAAVAEPAREAC
ncbi:MAG: ABC transporter ATP-binding protein [Chloroflexi bacterium]|nr:ABC transporter ATP-binding protein [Chloroflexota bacterium]